MSGYKTFAVAGAGGLGKFIIEELLKLQKTGKVESVTILSRSATGYADLVAQGAKLIEVNYEDLSSLVSAVTGIDVVISTIHGFGPALNSQDKLGEAAKSAGVKLFVPSQFGLLRDIDGWPRNPHMVAKEAFIERLKKFGLPYAIFDTGSFSDQLFDPGFAQLSKFDVANGKVTINGVGDAPATYTTRRDVGIYVAYVLTSLPREKLEWRTFRIQGDVISWNEIIKSFQAETGKTLEVTYRPRSELEEAYAKNAYDLFAFVLLRMDTGNSVVGTPNQLDNKEFPDWKPQKVIDVLKQFYA